MEEGGQFEASEGPESNRSMDGRPGARRVVSFDWFHNFEAMLSAARAVRWDIFVDGYFVCCTTRKPAPTTHLGKVHNRQESIPGI